MAAIGSLVFCTDCGNLLDPNTSRRAFITCDVCGTQNEGTSIGLGGEGVRPMLIRADTSSKVVVTKSKPSAFPSTLRTRLRSDVAEVPDTEASRHATIQRACEKCGTEEVRYYTQQLRSADEGTTIFFTCPKCGFVWIENN